MDLFYIALQLLWQTIMKDAIRESIILLQPKCRYKIDGIIKKFFAYYLWFCILCYDDCSTLFKFTRQISKCTTFCRYLKRSDNSCIHGQYYWFLGNYVVLCFIHLELTFQITLQYPLHLLMDIGKFLQSLAQEGRILIRTYIRILINRTDIYYNPIFG